MTNCIESLDFYDQFAADLQALNAFVYPRVLREYQNRIIETGQLQLTCPWSGQLRGLSACHVFNVSPVGFGDLVIAYRLEGTQPLWLLSGIVREGFPIHEALLAGADGQGQGKSIWRYFNDEIASLAGVRRQLCQLEQAEGGLLLRAVLEAEPLVLLGHPNFAHVMWNELPALMTIAEKPNWPAHMGRITLLYEPLKVVEDILLRASVDVSYLDRPEDFLGPQPGLVVRIGATQVSYRLRSKLLENMGESLDTAPLQPLVARLQGRSPVIWISVRLDARTASNQEDFLVLLAKAIAGLYPRAGIILDGFSFPDDIERSIYSEHDGGDAFQEPGEACLADMFDARERGISAYIDHLLMKLEHSNLDLPAITTSGLRMTEAIALGDLADYYITHAGTLQHKIAWTHNIPGIVHSNPSGLRPQVARWKGNQVEGGMPPSLIDDSYVTGLDSIRTLAKVERNRDYEFTHLAAVVDQVVRDMAVKLPQQ